MIWKEIIPKKKALILKAKKGCNFTLTVSIINSSIDNAIVTITNVEPIKIPPTFYYMLLYISSFK